MAYRSGAEHRQGRDFDGSGFWEWANAAQDLYPNAVAVIPDVIEGNEADNLMQASLAIRGGLAKYPERTMFVWHTNDSLEQLEKEFRPEFQHYVMFPRGKKWLLWSVKAEIVERIAGGEDKRFEVVQRFKHGKNEMFLAKENAQPVALK